MSTKAEVRSGINVLGRNQRALALGPADEGGELLLLPTASLEVHIFQVG